MFSRAQYEGVVAPNCTAVPGAVTIWQVAQDLASHGYAATEAASTSLEAETGERCNANGDLTLGWSDLRTLQSQYGWTITARGNGDDRTLSTAQQTADSCDLLPTFVERGLQRRVEHVLLLRRPVFDHDASQRGCTLLCVWPHL